MVWRSPDAKPELGIFVYALVDGKKTYYKADGRQTRVTFQDAPMVVQWDGYQWMDMDDVPLRLKVKKWMDVPYDLR